LRTLGLTYDDAAFATIIDKYLQLDLYPDALPALSSLKGRKLAILSNGSPDMLNTLVANTGLDSILDATISVDAKKVFKPSPDAYTLIESTLGIGPHEVLFVSSNPWDACGAKSFGLNVAWIERVAPEAMALACVDNETVAPITMFKALRTQMDELGVAPDHRIRSLSELPGVVAFHES
jgi:2-haloacid dehalogenase